MYKSHKWFAVVAGGFFIVWILSGILTMFQLPLEDSGQGKDLPLDFRMATISPSKAIQIVEKISGKTVEVSEVHLDEILGKVVYRVYINHGPSHLIDAQMGKEIIIDKQMGEEIAKSRLPNHMEILHTEYLETHTSEYSNGPLPVYKISFNDTWNTLSIVEKSSGKERHNNLWGRGKGKIVGLHFFSPIEQVTGSQRLRKVFVILVGILGIGAACTGFYLAFNRRRL